MPDRMEEGALLDELREVVFRTDPEGRWTYLNPAWVDLTGFSVEESLHHAFLDYVHPDEQELTLALFQAVVEGGASACHHDTRYRRADGSYRWVELRARVLRDADGQIVANVGTLIDITERRRATDLLAAEAKALELIARDAPLSQCLGAVARLVEVAVGGPVAVDLAPRGGGEGELPEGRVPVRSSNGRRLLGSFALPPAADLSSPTVDRAVHLAAIAVERRHVDMQLRHQALHDPLTGLPNRTLLEDRLRQTLRLAGRHGGTVAVLLADLDGFKALNDRLGHQAGDACLVEVASRIRSAVREVDTVGRLGGDEFAVVLPMVDGRDGALHVADRVAEAVQRRMELGVSLGVSVGVALAPDHGSDPIELLRHADAAMYRTKQAGGGVGLYDPDLDAQRQGRLALAAELLGAPGAGDLRLHYQPIIDLRTGRTAAVEALVRWQHPTRGLLLPETFVPIAESSGTIRDLTRWVIEEVRRDQERWQAAGREVQVQINLTAADLGDAELAGALRQAAPLMTVEVTESAALTEGEGLVAALDELAGGGVRVALDDFGARYASLGTLTRLPASELKVDRSIVRDLTVDERDASIVRAAIELGHTLGLTVVAEGVEDQASLDRVRALGCDRAQGFHLSRPLPAQDLLRWLADGDRA